MIFAEEILSRRDLDFLFSKINLFSSCFFFTHQELK